MTDTPTPGRLKIYWRFLRSGPEYQVKRGHRILARFDLREQARAWIDEQSAARSEGVV